MIIAGMDKKVWVDRAEVRAAIKEITDNVEEAYEHLDKAIPNVVVALDLLQAALLQLQR